MREAPGILKWMIEGCLDWQRNGLVRPPSVRAATEAYFSDQDLMGQWIDDACDVSFGNAVMWERSADLFESWIEYANKSGERPGSQKTFSEALKRRGFEPYRVPGSGLRAFRFVRLRAPGVTRDGL